MKKLIIFVFYFILFSCSNFEKKEKEKIKSKNLKKEIIYRKSNDSFFEIPDLKKRSRLIYPWEMSNQNYKLAKIEKGSFKCKGSSLNAPIMEEINGDDFKVYYDCEGANNHSLPFFNGKEEGIYQILIDLLNYIQFTCHKKVIITCGHRCPIHNIYADKSKNNKTSKHMIGAEVDFYVQDFEQRPKEIILLIFKYYQEKYKNVEYTNFFRYEKDDSNVKIKPWYNKEIFVKLYQENEGRDLDNNHFYPYIGIQVLYDNVNKQKVYYSWDKAFNAYKRW